MTLRKYTLLLFLKNVLTLSEKKESDIVLMYEKYPKESYDYIGPTYKGAPIRESEDLRRKLSIFHSGPPIKSDSDSNTQEVIGLVTCPSSKIDCLSTNSIGKLSSESYTLKRKGASLLRYLDDDTISIKDRKTVSHDEDGV